MTEQHLTAADIQLIQDLLLKFEEAKATHILTPEEIESVKRIIETFDRHGPEIEAILKREQVSRLWAEIRLKFWAVIKWFLGAVLLIMGVVQGYQALLSYDKWWFK